VTRGRALASVSALLLCLVMSKCEDALFHLSVPDLALQDAGHAIIGHALVDQMLATLILAPAASAMSYSAQQMPTHELFRIFPLPLPDRDRTSTFCSVLPAAHPPFLLGCSQPAFSGFATEAGQARPLLSTSELPGRLMNGGADQAGRRSHPARSVRYSKQSGETTNPVAVRRCLPRPIAIRASWLPAFTSFSAAAASSGDNELHSNILSISWRKVSRLASSENAPAAFAVVSEPPIVRLEFCFLLSCAITLAHGRHPCTIRNDAGDPIRPHAKSRANL
jgi:hypothetical protein